VNKSFTEGAWDDYVYWEKQDRRVLKRLNMLLKDIERNGYTVWGTRKH